MPNRSVRLVACLALWLPTAAGADDFQASLSAAELSGLMHTWSDGERSSIIPFAGTGAATAVAGGLLLGSDSAVARGCAWPLLTVGALEVLAGVFFAVRAGPHRVELDHLLAEDPQEFARVERAHLHRIRDRFQPVLLIAEAVVTVAGGAMAGIGAYRHQDALTGIGIGVSIQGLALFLLDWAVLDRARAYTSALDLFLPDASR